MLRLQPASSEPPEGGTTNEWFVTASGLLASRSDNASHANSEG